MAIDQVLLEMAVAPASLRFYEWEPAALSLGYFQSRHDRQQHVASHPLPLVRRSTGGGAIVHDRELTYCLVLPVSDRFRATEQLVADVHQALIAALSAWDTQPTLWDGPSHDRPFLCFQRRARFDVVLDQHKVAGSAQRRQRGRALLHGSVLLHRSAFAPELPGICDISGRTVPTDQLASSWAHELTSRLNFQLCPGALTATEIAASKHVEQQRFSSAGWNFRR